ASLIQKIEGKLSPVTSAIFVLNPKPAAPPKLVCPKTIMAGETLNLGVVSSVSGAALYSIHVSAPDGTERAWLNATKTAADGTLAHSIPFALNDAPGEWKIT